MPPSSAGRELSAIARNEERGGSSGPGTHAGDGGADGGAEALDPALRLHDDYVLVIPKLGSLPAVSAIVAEVKRLVPRSHLLAEPAP